MMVAPGPLLVGVRRKHVKIQVAEGPPAESIMVAPGHLLGRVPRKHVKIQVAKGPPTECIMAAPGQLLVGVWRKHVKIRAAWAAENFLFAPNRIDIGADLRHRVFEGVVKMRRRGS